MSILVSRSEGEREEAVTVLRAMTGDHHRRERLNKTARSSIANVIENSGPRADGISTYAGIDPHTLPRSDQQSWILPVCQSLKGG